VILAITLAPGTADEHRSSMLCLLCRDGALADGLLNAALFLPLGAALTRAGWRSLQALSLGAVLSLGIEVVQLVIPGRDPSLADVVFNSLGAALGIAVARSASAWWRPGPRTADRLVIAGTLAAMSVIALTGVLFGASFPEDTYYGGWTPRFSHLLPYGGRVLGASVADLEIPSGVIGRSLEVHQRLLSDSTLRVRAEAGPRPAGLAPLLTINDAHRREILFLGADGDDLVYRYRTRAMDWGLIGPEIRAVGLLRGISPRDPLAVVVRRAHPGWCIRLNAIERCGLGHTIGTGWALLLGWQPLAPWLQPALRVAWLAALFFPLGLWARLGPASLVAAALSLAGLLIVPASVSLLPTPGVELLGALAGVLTGRIVGRSRGTGQGRS
jgi:hypothetical protein